jgi:hypothetical protein
VEYFKELEQTVTSLILMSFQLDQHREIEQDDSLLFSYCEYKLLPSKQGAHEAFQMPGLTKLYQKLTGTSLTR